MTRSSPSIIWLAEDFEGPFPSSDYASSDPDGLLAAGGNLSPTTLLNAYSQGIFPWYDESQPILWWTPDPRCVLFPNDFHVSRSFKRTLNSSPYEITVNRAFNSVIRACAEPRSGQEGTWIVTEMIDAYNKLHSSGHAISVECWQGDRLVGGIYGLLLGRIFFGESMFSRENDASKVAMHYICTQIDIEFIDCQVRSEHLISLGATMIDRSVFTKLIEKHI